MSEGKETVSPRRLSSQRDTGAWLMPLKMMDDPVIKKGNEIVLEKLHNSA